MFGRPVVTPPIASDTVVGRTGFRYAGCTTVADVENHLRAITDRIRACRIDELIEGLRADQDCLMARRRYLQQSQDPEPAL